MPRRVSNGRPRRVSVSARSKYLRGSGSNSHVATDDLGALLAQTSDLLCLLDDQLRFVYANPSFRRVLGCDPSALLGQPAAALLHPEDQPRWRALATSGAAPATLRLRHADESWRWIEFQHDPLAKDGRRYSLLSGRDVSARVEAERRRQQDTGRFQRLMQSNIVGIIIADLAGNIIEANDAFLRMLGYNQQDLRSGSFDWRAITSPEYLPQDEQKIAELLSTGHADPAEKVYIHKDGSRVPVLLGVTMDVDAKDRTICFVLDLREQKRAEVALRESQRFIQQLADAVPELLYVYDLRERRNVYANREVVTILGYTAADIQRMGDQMLQLVMHPDDFAEQPQVLARIMASGDGEVTDLEYRMRHADGSWRWLFGRSLVITRADDGTPLQILGTAQDITERKRADQRLQLLAESSRILAASLEYAATLPQMARRVTRDFADWCVIDLIDGEQRTRLVAEAQADSLQSSLPGWQELLPDPFDDSHPMLRPMHSGVAELHADLQSTAGDALLTEDLSRLTRSLDLRSALLVPLSAQDRPLGMIALFSGTARPYDADDLNAAEELARQIALTIDNARLYHQAQQHTERLHILSEASRAFAETSLDLVALLDRISRHVVAVLGDVCVIRLFSDDGVWLNPVAVFHPDPEQLAAARDVLATTQVRVGEGLTGRVASTGTTIRIPAALDVSRSEAADLALLERYGIVSALIVALRAQNQVIGTLFLGRSWPLRPYSAADQQFLEDIADRAALAITSARLYAAEYQARRNAEHAAARTAQLQSVTAALAEALTPTQVANVIVREGVRALGADAGSIYGLSDDGEVLELLSYIGYPEELVPVHARIPAAAESPLNEAVRSRELLVIEDPETLVGRWPRLARSQAITGDAAVAAAPLLVDQRILGAIYMAFRTPRQFSAEDRAFLTTLARQCAQAFERARLYAAEQQARSAAQAAVHLRDVFLSIASHELKTPVTALLGYVELLQRRALQSGVQERDLRSIRTIHEQAKRLTKLIGSLLDISRIETGQLRLEPAPLDFGALVQRMVSEMQPVLDRYTFIYDLPQEPLIVNGDALRLEQVLHNLFQNAIRYSPAGGTITIQMTRQDERVRLTVADQGIGIPSAALPHLFQRFYRAHAGDAHQISGLGIGLYVVKEIIALHGGSVGVESTEGSGSVFTIDLPLALPAEQ
jgi:PAS domain S-box-containing protein